jgi:hypothetical protein
MQNHSFRYTRCINWRQKRTGHLFQGRYKSILVDLDTYLLQLVAYIHKNPVRAGMVEQPADFPWSSHQVYLGKTSLPWLTVGPVLSQFSPKVDRARKLGLSYQFRRVAQAGAGCEAVRDKSLAGLGSE